MTPRVRHIMEAVAKDHGVSVTQLIALDRRKAIAHARFDAMARLRQIHTCDGRHKYSLPQIGSILGGLDHTSVMHGLRRAAELFGALAPIYPVFDSEETRI